MSRNWYVLAFGVELGPMSWDDLLERARRGDLRRDSQVRQGEYGPFIHAGDVAGLFAALSVQASDSMWFCELLGAELGPMPWEELCLLGERGTLRGDGRVRRGSGAWMPASSVTGLFQSPAATIDHSKAPSIAAAAPPVEVAGPEAVLGPETTVAEPRAEAVVSPPPPSEPSQAEPAAEKQPEPAGPIPPTSDGPAKPVKKAARTRASSPRARVRLPGKQLAVLAGLVLMAYAGYWGWTHWPRSATTDYRSVAVLYRQAYDQIKQFRTNPQNQSPLGLQFRFSRTVGVLRKQLEQSSGDPSAGQLAEAGTQLTQMLADCQAASGSAEETRFSESEQRFLAILDSLPNGQQ